MPQVSQRQAGAPSNPFGDVDLLPTDELAERFDSFRHRLVETREGFDYFVTVENFGSNDIGFADAYLNNRMGFAVFFHVGNRDLALIVSPSGGDEPRFPHGDAVRALNFVDLEPVPIGDEQEVTVLVRVSETFEGPDREVLGLGRLYLVHDKLREVGAEFLNFRVGTRNYKLRLIDVDWEVDPGIGLLGGIPDFAREIVEAGQERLDGRSGEHDDILTDRGHNASDLYAQFAGFGIVVGPNFTGLF